MMANSERRPGLDGPRPQSEAHLVLARPSAEGAEAYCRDHLTAGGVAESAPIVVLADGDSDRRESRSDPGGTRGVFVVMDDERSGGGDAVDSEEWPATVFTSADVGATGRTVDGYLRTWSETGYRPAVCVDSLTGLIERSSIHGAYRFLYVLRRRIDELEGDLHVHVDPSEHDEEIIRTFFSVFDRVVAFDDGGSPLP